MERVHQKELYDTHIARCDGSEKIPIQCSKLKILTEVNPIKNSQLKRGQITKNTPDRIRDHTNHFQNTN
ncbi:hypothetical protein H5410_052040 [Solanum commersonii]|uniref:Uncharacterized protein n=1 Tax=Solanum commersonii TaxID=4109 RepID=A0A9J5X1V6_SOLCO|nr:hypothetical protein H5410_052040 [Solanum commersonii]